jgi:diketogulonate reductase-like aldo/keto reductase
MTTLRQSRRALLASVAGIGLAAALPAPMLAAEPVRPRITKKIPKSGEPLATVGMGTWITFNVGSDQILRARRCEVLDSFFQLGGGMVDSSPMYGSSEEVIGYCMRALGRREPLFPATKVWTYGRVRGVAQLNDSQDLWGVQKFDLLQVHNLQDWEVHLETLQAWKDNGRVRYIGVTTSHGRRHAELEDVMTKAPIDFVQLTYNVLDREAETRLLPVAAERGVAVIANRPYRRGSLFDRFQRHPLPPWAEEVDCHTWADFFLKYITSHPAVTCAIPATTQVKHMRENMGASYGRLPEVSQRNRMLRYIEDL